MATPGNLKLLPLGLLLSAGLALSSTPGEAVRPAAPLQPQRIAASPIWSAEQVLQTTSKGKVIILRADTLVAYPIQPGGTLGKGAPLHQGSVAQSAFDQAAMSASGSRWLLITSTEAFLIDNGAAERLPSPGWRATSAAFLGEEPVVGAFPMMLGVSPGMKVPKAIPLTLLFTGREWSVHTEGTWPSKAGGVSREDALFANHTTQLIPAGRKLWVVWPYTYTVKRFSAGGRQEVEVVVGDGEASYRKDGERAQEQFAKSLAKGGYDLSGGFSAFTARRMVLGGAAGPDGKLYLLVSPARGDGALALDRYDPSLGTFERARLSLPIDGEVQVASGRDALYFASRRGNGGRWRLAWQTCDEAAWEEVDGVTVNGMELPPQRPGR